MSNKTMAEVKHTPWEVVPANEHHGFYVVDVAGRTVCDLYFIDRSDVDGGVRQFDGADTYARLIAAAPDHHAVALELDRLALVIESAVRFADPSFKDEVQALLRANKAALARARGEQDGGGE